MWAILNTAIGRAVGLTAFGYFMGSMHYSAICSIWVHFRQGAPTMMNTPTTEAVAGPIMDPGHRMGALLMAPIALTLPAQNRILHGVVLPPAVVSVPLPLSQLPDQVRGTAIPVRAREEEVLGNNYSFLLIVTSF